MSAREREPDAGPLRYAPKKARMAAAQPAQRRDRLGVSPENAVAGSPRAPASGLSNVRPLREPPPDWKAARRAGSFEGDVAVKELRHRMALAPDVAPAPPPREERSGVFGMVRRLTGLVTLAAVCAYGFVWISTPHGRAEDRGSSPVGFQQVLVDPSDAGGQSAEDAGRFTPAVFRPSPVPAAPRPDDRAAVAMEIPAALPAAMPPPNAGPSDVSSPTAAPADRRQALARTAWPGTDLPREIPTTGVAVAVPRAAGADAEEIATLLARGRTYLANGDIASARLVFRRGSEGGDAQAALALGGTYDPVVLKSLGAIGVAADPAQARGWYRKAAELGSQEAPKRIDQLAQTTR